MMLVKRISILSWLSAIYGTKKNKMETKKKSERDIHVNSC
jgi:hypothetical protein